MKRIVFYFVALMSFVACNKQTPTPPPADGPVRDTTYSLAFSYLGTGVVDTLDVGDYDEMELSEMQESWLSVHLEDGKMLLNVYATNEGFAARTATFSLSFRNGVEYVFNIKQSGYPGVEVLSSEMPEKTDDGRYKVTIDSIDLMGGAADVRLMVVTVENGESFEDDYWKDYLLSDGDGIYTYGDYLDAAGIGDDFVIESFLSGTFRYVAYIAIDEFGNPGKLGKIVWTAGLGF